MQDALKAIALFLSAILWIGHHERVHAQAVEQADDSFEYRIGEIYLSYQDTPKEVVLERANTIVEQLRGGASFAAYARQFSEASTASLGGDLGWARPNVLPVAIRQVATQLPVGALAGPIDVKSGYSIIYMINKRGSLANANSITLSLAQLRIDYQSIPLETFVNETRQIRSCDRLEATASRLGAQLVRNDSLPMSALPLVLQERIADLPIGYATPPFGSREDGIKVLVLCARNGATSQSEIQAANLVVNQPTGPRIALVIGNGQYSDGLGSLPNPTNDARLIRDVLRERGFDVEMVSDATQREMLAAIGRYGERLERAGSEAVGLFYFAGHGVQSRGVNYLVPTDARLAREADLELEAVSAQAVLSQIEYADISTSIMILDACRNMPLARTSRSINSGLSQMDAPNGSFIAFSTAPGLVAADGDGANSPYTTALAKFINVPNLPIESMFRQVRKEVYYATDGDQVPWESTSLLETFYFNLGSAINK